MYLTDLKTKSGETLPKLHILEKKGKEGETSCNCWGCPSFSIKERNTDFSSCYAKIYNIPLQFEGFKKVFLSLCERCYEILRKSGFSALCNRVDFIHSKDGEISPIAPECIEIHVSVYYTRCYKIQSDE